MTFSDPSDVIIQIEIENEVHDIHVMVRPGVKEFLEKMDKLYEIVIFTASVSKYADPLLDIIDKKGYCPFRLFREHCSLINTTFVKDLQRLGRDLKNIVIVDNSPLSYALHPENGLPILTWFEDKSDRELYTIMPVLEFLSTVQDVREFIPKFVGKDNKINYERANEIMKNYNGPRIVINDTEEDGFNKNNNNIYKNNGKEINIQIISNNSKNNYIQHKIDKTNSNTNNNISNKENKDNNNGNKDKLVEMAMKNIIASVSPNQVAYNNSNTSSNTHSNPILRNKPNSKNKIYINNKKNSTVDEDKIPKEKNNIKININNSINVKKLINVNHTAHSTKKFKGSITDGNFKSKQKRKNYSTGGNYIKNGSINLNPDSKSIILKSENHNCNILVKSKNATPKINKTINLLNKSNHTTRSVKYTKKTNAYIIIPTPNNNTISKMSKSLTKKILNS
jgi:Dullard-like phosphatase family protein